MSAIALDRVLGDVKPQKVTATKEITGVCDSCGTRASYEAIKNGTKLSFCGHHTRKNAASLLERGFVIFPENYEFNLTVD